MPWRVTDVLNERMRFVIRLESGERMVDLCREFGISRKTGYKFWNRFKNGGPTALGDFSRRPGSHPNQTPDEIRELVVLARRAHPTWGPKKLRVVLRELHPGLRIPAASTIGQVLQQEGMSVRRRRRRRCVPTPVDMLTQPEAPNDVWCADFKGQFKTADGRYCYPLTVTDEYSRYLLACEGQENTRTEGAYAAFSEVFETYGLPKVIRTDNGAPFASSGLGGLSRLSVWWRRLGIKVERIEPGHPEQNGRHERMHLTLKIDTTRPPGANLLHQQERFDLFRRCFNEERPHEALEMKRPADFYTKSTLEYPDMLEELHYPLHDTVRAVHESGHVYIAPGCNVYISKSLAREHVGLRELEMRRWLVTFLDIDLGIADERHQTLEPIQSGAQAGTG